MNDTAEQRIVVTGKRHLPFSGAKNFRDLGGYRTIDGRTVRWGVLYRSDGLHKLTNTDLNFLSTLELHQVVDFRSEFEQEMAPDCLPVDMVSRVVQIPILDHSTQTFQGSRDELVRKIKKIDAAEFLTNAYMEFASRFTPEIHKFMKVLISSNGLPILFHCTAGKDRTGFAAAVILRILGIPHDVVIEDYLLSNKYFYSAHRWNLTLMRILKGRQFSETVKGFMLAQPAYLSAAFGTIDRNYGSFEKYVCDGLGLTTEDVEQLKCLYLE